MATIKIDGRFIDNHWIMLQDISGNIYQRTDIPATYPDFYFNGGNDFGITQPIPTFDLTDGIYNLNPQNGSNFSLEVVDGIISYGTDCDTFLDGRDTDTLILKGHCVTIDARYLVGNGLTFWGVLGYGASDPKGNGENYVINKTCQLLPGSNYYFVVASAQYGDFFFTINKDGSISIDAKYSLFTSLSSPNTILISGFPILIDATKNGTLPLSIFGVYGIWDNPPFTDNHTLWTMSKVIMGNFMPIWESHGFYAMVAYGGRSGVSKDGFRVSPDGTVEVSDSTLLTTDFYNGIRRVNVLRDLPDRIS
jgi:hypothetical protein